MSRDSSKVIFVRVLKHRAALMAVIVAIVRDFTAAEDLFQETALEIVRGYDRFKEDRDFLAWAKGVARHLALRHIQSAKRREVSVDPSALEVFAEVMMEEDEPETWEKERVGLRHCLEKLPERSRKLFVLRYGRNLKGRGLSDESGVTPGSLRTTLARVRALLRGCVESYLRHGASPGGELV